MQVLPRIQTHPSSRPHWSNVRLSHAVGVPKQEPSSQSHPWCVQVNSSGIWLQVAGGPLHLAGAQMQPFPEQLSWSSHSVHSVGVPEQAPAGLHPQPSWWLQAVSVEKLRHWVHVPVHAYVVLQLQPSWSLQTSGRANMLQVWHVPEHSAGFHAQPSVWLQPGWSWPEHAWQIPVQ